MQIARMIIGTSGNRIERAAYQHDIAGHVKIGLQHPEDHENPCQPDKERAGMLGVPGEDGEHVEQDRQLKLIREGIGGLPCARRPARLAQRHILRLDDTAAKIPLAQRAHHQHERESENDLDKKWRQNCAERHRTIL
jgi:hypothetical protein